MEIRSAIASIPKEGEVQKMPNIQMTALYCILLSSLKGYDNDTLL